MTAIEITNANHLLAFGLFQLPEIIAYLLVALIFGAEGAAMIFRHGKERRKRLLFEEIRGKWDYTCEIDETIQGDRVHGGECVFTLTEEEFSVRLGVAGDRHWTAPSLNSARVHSTEVGRWEGEGVIVNNTRFAYLYHTELRGRRYGYTNLEVLRDPKGKLIQLRGRYLLVILPSKRGAKANQDTSEEMPPVLHGVVTMKRPQ